MTVRPDAAEGPRGLRPGEVPLATARALADPGFWPRALRTSLGVGVLYVAWLALLGFTLGSVVGARRVMPAVDAFVDWLVPRLPAVRFTPDGPQADVAQPFVLEHPELGPVLRIDTGGTLDQDAPAWVSVLQDRVVFARQTPDGRREYRAVDVVPRTPEARAGWNTVTLDGPTVADLYRTLRPSWVVVPLVASLGWLSWKLLAALGYATIAVGLARALGVPAGYAALVATSCFALTAVTIAEWATIVGWPNAVAEPVPSVLVTVAYLLAALLLERGTASTAGSSADGGRRAGT